MLVFIILAICVAIYWRWSVSSSPTPSSPPSPPSSSSQFGVFGTDSEYSSDSDDSDYDRYVGTYDRFCNGYRPPPAMFVVPPEYQHLQKKESFATPQAPPQAPQAYSPMRVSRPSHADPRATAGAYPTQRPAPLADLAPQMAAERNGVSLTNGKANRILWGLDSAVKAGVQTYPKFPTAITNYDDDTSLEDAFVYANNTPTNYTVLADSPNTPDEFINASTEITPRLSSFKPPTGLSGGEADYRQYVRDTINIDDMDGRITNANLNKGFKIIQANALAAQSKVEKYRPLYEESLRSRRCWMNADDPIM